MYARERRLTWLWCSDQFKGRNRNKHERPLAKNTRLYDFRGFNLGLLPAAHFAVKLHNTYILRIYADGHHTVAVGGWTTVTTKDRLNRYTNANIYSANGTWWTRYGDVPIAFEDGMEFDLDGNLVPNGRLVSIELPLYQRAYETILAKRPQGYATWGLMEKKVYTLAKQYRKADDRLAE